MQFSRFLRRVPVTLGFRRCKSSAGRGTSARPWPMTSRWVAAVDVVDMEPRTKHGSFHSVSIVFVVDVPIFGWVMWVYTYYIRIHFFACDASIPIFGVLTYPSITLHAWFYPTPCLMIDIPPLDQPFAIPKAMLRVLNVMRMNDPIKEALRHWIWSPNFGSNLGFGDEATAGYNTVLYKPWLI